MSTHRLLILMAALFSSAFVLGSLGWQEPVQAAQGEKGNESDESGAVTLRIAGDKDTRFSGICSVGQEERKWMRSLNRFYRSATRSFSERAVCRAVAEALPVSSR